jgi:hypothetical protein
MPVLASEDALSAQWLDKTALTGRAGPYRPRHMRKSLQYKLTAARTTSRGWV